MFPSNTAGAGEGSCRTKASGGKAAEDPGEETEATKQQKRKDDEENAVSAGSVSGCSKGIWDAQIEVPIKLYDGQLSRDCTLSSFASS